VHVKDENYVHVGMIALQKDYFCPNHGSFLTLPKSCYCQQGNVVSLKCCPVIDIMYVVLNLMSQKGP